MSSYDPAAAAAASPAKAAPDPMPLSMTFSSLEWMVQSAGVPRDTDETPPTSPEKARRRTSAGGGGGTAAAAFHAAARETEAERAARQAAFIREKNRELQLLRESKSDAHANADDDADDADGGDAGANEAADLTTPPRRVRPAAGTADAASPASSASSSAAAAAMLVSPEKRRAKKLSSLQYPIFSVYWWDYPPPAQQQPDETDLSSAAIARAAKSAQQREGAQHPPSLGLVLLGGGGGKKGAGIDSGMLVCSVLPSNAPVLSLGNSPIRLSSVSSKALQLHPTAFLDSNDYLIGHMVPHPSRPVLAATVGAGTAILDVSPPSAGDSDPYAPPRFDYSDLVQTDFSKDLSAQAQAWSPSGSWLVTGGEDRVLRAWAYPGLELLAVLGSVDPAGAPNPQAQHRNPILSLDVNHDGTRVASCAGDGSIKIWNTAALEGVRERASEHEHSEPEQLSESDRAAWSSSKLLRCPLVKDVTIPLIKGSILKFQQAKFFGKARVTKRKSNNRRAASAPARGEGNEDAPEGEEKEEEQAAEADASDEFASASSGSGPELLIAIASQIRRGGGSSCLVKFRGCGDWARLKQTSTGSAALTCMEMSDDVSSPLVALANTDGQVAVYSAEHMRCVKRVRKCHDLPTTALAFSPARLSAGSATSPATTRWLLSASADKSVALIALPSHPHRSSSSQRAVIFFALAALLLLIAVALGKEPWNLPQSDL